MRCLPGHWNKLPMQTKLSTQAIFFIYYHFKHCICKHSFKGSAQNCCNSSTLAMELLQSCAEPSLSAKLCLYVPKHFIASRAAYRCTIRSGYRYYPIPIQGIEMTHSKRYSKSILTSSIWQKSNNNITKYHPANRNIPVYSNKMRKFDMWTLPWQALWQFPLHIITAQAVAVGCVWCSWWQFSTFQCRKAPPWIIWLNVDIAIWIELISVSKCGISIGIDIEKSVTICSPKLSISKFPQYLLLQLKFGKPT